MTRSARQNLRSDRGRMTVTLEMNRVPKGLFSSKSPLHPYRHEIGHALWMYFWAANPKVANIMEAIYKKYFELSDYGIGELSLYAAKKKEEMVAEAIAECLNGNPRPFAKAIVKILMRYVYDDHRPHRF